MSSLRPNIANRARTGQSAAAQATEIIDLVGSRVHVDIIVPRTQIAAKMRLVSRGELFEIQADTRRVLMEAGFPLDASAMSLGAGEQWQYELGVRTLQKAIRNPSDLRRELASLDEWRDCDDDQIAALYQEYQTLAERLDPLGAGAVFTDLDFSAIEQAVKKKDPDLLMSFGPRKLSSFMLTLAARLASSATPTSSSGPASDSRDGSSARAGSPEAATAARDTSSSEGETPTTIPDSTP